VTLAKLARQYNISCFRPGQEETMLHVLRGDDTLAIMPTGAGKSLCYQLPAQILTSRGRGTAIVVSPLISLMNDQHRKLTDMGFASQHLSSELTRKQAEDAIRKLGEGLTDIQFVTPEKLENPEVLAAFRLAGVSLFVVDEAHCISEWGHDFRPAYLTLARAVEALGHPPILALTATATPEVTRDVVERLGFRDRHHVVRISYRRDNLLLRAREFRTEEGKFAALMKFFRRLRERSPGGVLPSGIVYCASVKRTESLAESLRRAGIPASAYHGRKRKPDRRRAQDRFMRRPGQIMVATSAFGMGIDKPDVRFVVNYQLPGSIESYIQEMGRAGRDGAKAHAILLYTRRDRALQRMLQMRKYPTLAFLTRALAALYDEEGERRPRSLSRAKLERKVGKRKLDLLLKALERTGHATVAAGKVRALRAPTPADISAMLEEWETRRREDRRRLDELVRYAGTGLCRWLYLLKYFGEDMEEPCGHCDNCVRHQGSFVIHRAWGVGEILKKIGPNLCVYFPGIGEKVLRAEFIQPWRPRATTAATAA
jgi:ATP-dependent DNA helicase RecQ